MTEESRQEHVTIVCCHAIWKGPPDGSSPGADAGLDDGEWMMEPFQAGEGVTFRQHVLEGIEVACERGGELWFSGGCTKRSRTSLSEGESYRRLCTVLLAHHPPLPTSSAPLPFTVHADPFATDSLQNIIFPLLQSPTYRPPLLVTPSCPIITSPFPVSPDPVRLTIVSHAFKRSRFVSQHLPALGLAPAWIATHVSYVGVDPPGADEDGPKRAAFEAGERRACEMWDLDPWGQGEVLAGKRRGRGWDEDGIRRAGEEMVMMIEEGGGPGGGVGKARKEVKGYLDGGYDRLDLARLLRWSE